MNNMTTMQALSILDQATNPQIITKLNRVDYVNIQQALNVLSAFISEHQKAEAQKEPDAS